MNNRNDEFWRETLFIIGFLLLLVGGLMAGGALIKYAIDGLITVWNNPTPFNILGTGLFTGAAGFILLILAHPEDFDF